jgi:hypothetical protein
MTTSRDSHDPKLGTPDGPKSHSTGGAKDHQSKDEAMLRKSDPPPRHQRVGADRTPKSNLPPDQDT